MQEGRMDIDKMNGWMDGRTDGRMGLQGIMDVLMDGWMEMLFHVIPQ